MDYFAEIAENPDIDEALASLQMRWPAEIRDARIGERPLSSTHPGVWRAVLVDVFHANPGFAAEVWRALGCCTSARLQLVRAAAAPTGLFSPKKRLLREGLELPTDADARDVEHAIRETDAAHLTAAQTALDRPYPGPAFIEKLVELDQTVAADKLATAASRMDAIALLIANPDRVREIARANAVPVPFAMAHLQELEQIDAARNDGNRAAAADVAADAGGSPLRHALNRNLVGLAFSGGGIRSATFSLGVLQALAKLDVLRHCDYLSTVSGGGYIGTWFTAWMQRQAQGETALEARTAAQTHDVIRQRLSPSHSPSPLDSRIRPIRYLREFSNYLTPKTGFFSADTWTMVAIYIRNVLLNWMVLIPLIAAVLLVPRAIFGLTQLVAKPWSAVAILFLIILPLCVLLPNLRRASPPPRSGGAAERPRRRDDGTGSVPRYARQGWIQFGVVIPFLAAACLTAITYHQLVDARDNRGEAIFGMALMAGVVFLIYLAVIHWAGRFYRSYPSMKEAVAVLVFATIGAAAAAFGLFWLLGQVIATFGDDSKGRWMAVAFGTPLTLATYSFIVVIQLGLLGTKFPDEQREWWSRLRAWTLIYSLAWTALFTGAIWIPYWLTMAAVLSATSGGSAIFAWALTTFAGIKAGRIGAAATKNSGASGMATSIKVPRSLKDRSIRLVALVAPYVFIVGLVTLISYVIHVLLHRIFAPHSQRYDWDAIAKYPIGSTISFSPPAVSSSLVLIGALLVAVSLVVSWRIGVNEFSMHHFYKNRLVRCYLGASRWQTRKADWFTGFDSEDDVRLTAFDHQPPRGPNGRAYGGPYPIVNAALNLVAGEDLAWQERKATSFVFTPKYCGYDVDRAVMQKNKGDDWPDAYAPTCNYVSEGTGPMLGTAMAISGAAASPNMGKLSSPASAFLMTVFNARLGWWLPNTRRKGGLGRWRRWLPGQRPAGWNSSGPKLGINYTAIELFGMTDDNKKFVNLSDGGHFENLGVYELIRRGCRYVIVSDAGQDGAFGLEDLGNLIRKCRLDFGVEIEIATDSIRDRTAVGWSRTHCVVGKIHYHAVPKYADGRLTPDANGEIPHEQGLLIYMKPSITGDEPFDVLEYYRRVPEFPHESTADQWFNESQFESYRRLGFHVCETTFRRDREQPEAAVQNTTALFRSMSEFWHPPSPRVAEHATTHAEAYSRVMELLRSRPEFSPLDRVLFPTAPQSGLTDRNEFYICNTLIQLMENVYTDLDLEQYYEHPHVQGWMAVFREWANQEAFHRTWMINRETYATRFRRFYDDRLRKRT
jgi:patatin-like phospholipase